MRILVANDGLRDAGGVHTYLAAVVPALLARGHEIALLHLAGPDGPEAIPGGTALQRFAVAEGHASQAQRALAWKPDVAFSHNMRDLEVDSLMARSVPLVKMMHGYFGTCVSGLKMHLFPEGTPCGKPLGPGCVPVYAVRRCGPMNPVRIATSYRWARRQNAMFADYAAFVVASRHMQREYVANGAPPERVHCVPLFAPHAPAPAQQKSHDPLRVLFLGRMTPLKGGDVLIRAAARAQQRVHLVLAGDGPERMKWQALAASLGVHADFPGWVDGPARAALLESASLLAMPSVWPEPFGLSGLEAAACSVPAVGFDNGGIGEWLVDGENGWLVRGPDVGNLAAALDAAASDRAQLARMAAGAARTAARMTVARHLHALEAVLEGAH